MIYCPYYRASIPGSGILSLNYFFRGLSIFPSYLQRLWEPDNIRNILSQKTHLLLVHIVYIKMMSKPLRSCASLQCYIGEHLSCHLSPSQIDWCFGSWSLWSQDTDRIASKSHHAWNEWVGLLNQNSLYEPAINILTTITLNAFFATLWATPR